MQGYIGSLASSQYVQCILILSNGHVVYTQYRHTMPVHDIRSIHCTLYKVMDHCFLILHSG